MAVSKELIERKANQYRALLKDLNILEKSLANDLIELDKQAFGGKTWGEYLMTIHEEIEFKSEGITIYRDTYRISATYVINESATLNIVGNIYYGDDRYRVTLVYESGRTLQEVPNKYQKFYDRLVSKVEDYKVKRPSDEYVKELGAGITTRL